MGGKVTVLLSLLDKLIYSKTKAILSVGGKRWIMNADVSTEKTYAFMKPEKENQTLEGV